MVRDTILESRSSASLILDTCCNGFAQCQSTNRTELSLDVWLQSLMARLLALAVLQVLLPVSLVARLARPEDAVAVRL